MMQIAKDDIYDDYVVCRGFDPRIQRFVDFAENSSEKPGISVAKPFGCSMMLAKVVLGSFALERYSLRFFQLRELLLLRHLLL